MGMVGCIDAPFPDPSQCAVVPGARLGGEEGQPVGGAQRPEEGAIAQVERNGCLFLQLTQIPIPMSNVGLELEVGWVVLGLWVSRP